MGNIKNGNAVKFTATIESKKHCALNCVYMAPSKGKVDKCKFIYPIGSDGIPLEKDDSGFNVRTAVCIEYFGFGEWE